MPSIIAAKHCAARLAAQRVVGQNPERNESKATQRVYGALKCACVLAASYAMSRSLSHLLKRPTHDIRDPSNDRSIVALGAEQKISSQCVSPIDNVVIKELYRPFIIRTDQLNVDPKTGELNADAQASILNSLTLLDDNYPTVGFPLIFAEQHPSPASRVSLTFMLNNIERSEQGLLPQKNANLFKKIRLFLESHELDLDKLDSQDINQRYVNGVSNQVFEKLAQSYGGYVFSSEYNSTSILDYSNLYNLLLGLDSLGQLKLFSTTSNQRTILTQFKQFIEQNHGQLSTESAIFLIKLGRSVDIKKFAASNPNNADINPFKSFLNHHTKSKQYLREIFELSFKNHIQTLSASKLDEVATTTIRQIDALFRSQPTIHSPSYDLLGDLVVNQLRDPIYTANIRKIFHERPDIRPIVVIGLGHTEKVLDLFTQQEQKTLAMTDASCVFNEL